MRVRSPNGCQVQRCCCLILPQEMLAPMDKFHILRDVTVTRTLTSKKWRCISPLLRTSAVHRPRVRFSSEPFLNSTCGFSSKFLNPSLSYTALSFHECGTKWEKSIHPWSTSITPSIASKLNSKVSISRIEADLNSLCKRGMKRPSHGEWFTPRSLPGGAQTWSYLAWA